MDVAERSAALMMAGERTVQSRWISIFLRGVEVWLVISVLEVLHGIARAVFLQPFVGDLPARQIGVFTGSLLIIFVAYFFRRWIGAARLFEQLGVGLIWVVLTICFEILLGRLVLDLPWQRILSDYDIPHGGLMPFGLLVMLLAPMLTARTHDSRQVTTHE